MRFHKTAAEEMIGSEAIRRNLEKVGNVDLGSIDGPEWSGLTTPIRALLSEFLRIRGVGLAVATKVLHLKRPKLFPILDSYVVSFVLGEKLANAVSFASSKETVVRLGMQALEVASKDLLHNAEAFQALEQSLHDLPIPLEKVRLYDILCWTTEKWNRRGETKAPYGSPSRSLMLAKRSEEKE